MDAFETRIQQSEKAGNVDFGVYIQRKPIRR